MDWKIHVLAPHAPGAALNERLEGIQITRFRYLWPDGQETVCYQGGALINLRRNRFNVLKIPALVGAELMAAYKLLASGSYDLVHSHWILPQGFVGALTAPRFKLPHVITVHGGDVFSLRGPVLEKFKRFALESADAVTVNSSVTEAAVKQLAEGIREIRRIPMGVNTNTVNADPSDVTRLWEQFGCGQGPLILFVGRLVEEKGINDLLEAVSQLKSSRFPEISAIIVGEGQDRTHFESSVRRLGIEQQVHFTGWINPDDLHKYYSAADIFVSPSYSEGQGLSIIEAMANKVPVVSTGVGGVLDAVEDERTGLLVAPHSPEQIAAAVERLVSSPGLGRTLRLNARAEVERRFSRQASALAFSQLFESLIDGARGA